MGPGASLLVLPGWLVDDPTQEPRADWGVRVADGMVDEVGPNKELTTNHPDDEVVVAPDSIL